MGSVDPSPPELAEIAARIVGAVAGPSLAPGFYEALLDQWTSRPDESETARIELYAVVRAMRITKFSDHRATPTGAPNRRVEDFLPGLRPAAESLARWLARRA